MKRCLASLVIREMQIKAVLKCHCVSTAVAEMQRTDHTKCWCGCEAANIPQC